MVTLDCVQIEPTGIVPDDLYQVGSVSPTDSYPPFTKKLDVCGITLIAGDKISNPFMENVALTIKEMFIVNGNTDTLLQQILLTNLYQYKTVIPLFYGEDWSIEPENESAWDALGDENSVCDIIMEGVPDPVMEVVEHILHHLTDIGLHYTYPADWGLTNSSRLYTITQEAISLGYYDIAQYSDIPETGVRNRVILQEYAYWVIYTAWDLRENYGPAQSEWSIVTGSELLSKLPESYALFQETIPSVMTCPSQETLNLF
ncbi:uncharacterized protein METZ01_LOCUS205128 [marine metagenome]|uniref:DUF4261 domain-containing protein n=1 Tax=marine metagenome TaxID=408172 RepID=A0A382EQ40_9ZZZZ